MADKQTVTGGPWTGVWGSQDPFDDRPDQLTALVNGYLPDPQHGSPAYQRPGVVALNGGSSLGTQTQAIYEHTALDGTRYVFAFVDGKVYRANTAAMAAWTDVSPTGVIIHTGSVAPFFIACTSLNDLLIVSDGVNKPWMGSSLSSTPIVATNIEYDGPTPDDRTGTNGIPTTTAQAVLSIGSNDVRLANTAFTYTVRSGGSIGTQTTLNANATGTAVGALGQIAAGTWGTILVELNTATAALVFTAAFNAGSGYATEALAVAARPALTTSRWYVGFATVQADAGAVWIAGTDAFATGSTGNQAQATHYYAGEGSPWNYKGPIGIYQGSLIGMLNQVATVYATATMEWSEPDDPSLGYNQTSYDDQWALTQTSADPVTSLQTTNAGIFYAREGSWGMLYGTLSVDLSNSTTSDAISENIGTLAPWTVDQFSNVIFFADAQGRPWRFAYGSDPEPIYLAMRTAAEQNQAQSTPLGQLPNVGWGIVEPNLNVWLYGFPSSSSSTNYAPTTLYCFDARTGAYNGTWSVLGGEAIGCVGIAHDSSGTPVLVMAGTNGGTTRGNLWKLSVPVDNNWQDNGAPVAWYAQSQRIGFATKGISRVPEVRALMGNPTPCTATMITSDGVTTAAAQAPVGQTLLSIGSNDTRVASIAFDYIINGAGYQKAAVTVGTAFSAQTVPQATWASYRASITAAGTITLTAAPDNTTGYATEQDAINDVPATPLASWDMGYLTVQAQALHAWIAATDALAGGTSGNEAQTTNYYAGEMSFDGTYKITFPLDRITGRGVQVQIAPTSTAPASASATQGQGVLYRIEADLIPTPGARDQR